MILNINKTIILILAVCIFLNFSCQKDETLGTSKEVSFVQLQLKGDKFIVASAASPFVDPGVTALVNKVADPNIVATVKGISDINYNTPGVYLITYTYDKKTEDGFALGGAPVYRNILVADPTATDNDLSGKYTRAATGASSVWTKLTKGIYLITNPGGAVGFDDFKVAVHQYGGNNVKIYPQKTSQTSTGSDVDVSTSTDTYTFNPAATSGTTAYSWILLTTGFGTGSRIFAK